MKALSLLVAATLALAAPARADEPEAFSVHGQTTYIRQLKPSFDSPYAGPHSLSGAREWSYSLTGTLNLGARLPDGTEMYVDGEVVQGVAFSGLQGLAGFPNSELARTSGADATFYLARLFVRHTFALGAETEDVEAAADQLASRYAKHRVVVTAGNVSVLDVFDANAYSHDGRTQFMNWSLATHGAWDYPADSHGYTWGAAAEYFADGWSARAGRFAQPREPNGLRLDPRIFEHYGDAIELARDYSWAAQSGVVRLLAFRNRAVMARYDDALALAATDMAAPNLAAVRTADQVKTGIGVSLEHRFSADLGFFARAMRADGQTETYAYTEIDSSASAGLSMSGARWGRTNDTLGVAVACNALSASHRRFLEDGGETFFLGDGRLSYRPEQIVEAYYSVQLRRGILLAFDYQRIANPGYNSDRGPASFVAVRLHLER